MKGHRYNSPYPARKKQMILTMWLKEKQEDKYLRSSFVCRRYHVTERTLYRWKSQYDGTLNSLENKSHRPHSPHPNSQTEEEIKHIHDLIKRNPTIGLNELYGKLRQKYEYKRNPATLYRFLRKDGFYKKNKNRKRYIPKDYDTPTMLGEKWQLDVKYVPKSCKAGMLEDSNFYQYTVIDEASRQRFILPYQEICGANTVDFVERAIRFFGYKPKEIQTDNGAEFTYLRESRYDKRHAFDSFCIRAGIIHKLIKPRTPRHNGKVERSHRSDSERFYRYLKFYSFEDLKNQMSAYLKRSNNIPMSCIGWLSPNQKRKQLESACA